MDKNKTRTKGVLSPPPILEPKIREGDKSVQNIIIDDFENNKPKKLKHEYIRIAIDDTSDKRKVFNERILKNEITISHYAIDNDKGYLYYIVNKK